MAFSASKILKFRQPNRHIENRRRPLAWEDDFSTNTLDDAPFVVEPPIGSFPLKDTRRIFESSVPKSLRGDRDIESFMDKDPFPIPAGMDREGYCPQNHPWYWVDGLRDYLKIQDALQRYGCCPESVFELGCASGRVLRHICAQGEYPEVWGSDLNFRHVRWVMENLSKKVRMLHNHTFPTLPIAANSLDLVCAFSVFTHIDTFETAWIAEVHRILRKGGMGYITLHTEHTWNALGSYKADDYRVRVIRRCKGIRDQHDDLFESMPSERMIFRHTETGPYRGCIYHSESYIRDVWSRFFDILEIIPKFHGLDQTVMLIRKQN